MTRLKMLAALILALCGLVPLVRAAGEPTATVSLFDTPPKIDGRIAPGEWDGAVRIQGFQKHRGAMADKVGASWLGYSRERLYVAVVSELPPDGRLRAIEKKEQSAHDKLYGAGGIELWLDAHRGRRDTTKEKLPYVQCIANATNAIYDKKYGIPGQPPSVAWDGDWDFANGLHETTDADSPIQSENGIWVAEISISFSDLGLEDDPVGKTIGALIVRNWKRKRGGQMSWFPMGGNYSNWAGYPRIRLTEADPSGQITSLGERLYAGKLELRARLYNPSGRSRKVKVDAVATSSDMPRRTDSTTLELKPNDHTPYQFNATSFHEHSKHKLHLVVADADAPTRYLDYTMDWRKPKRAKWRTEETGPQPDKAVRLEYYPSYGFIRLRIDPREVNLEAGSVQSAVVKVAGPDGAELLSQTLRWDAVPARRRLEVGTDLAPGRYTVRVHLDGYENAFERRFVREYFPWEGNRLGITDKVYAPFDPVRQQGKTVSVVMREYRQDGLGLWSSVRARGNDEGSEMRELLAGPIALHVGDGAMLKGSGEFTSVQPQAVIYEGRAAHPAVLVETKTTTEYDGVMKVEITLTPPETPVPPLESLYVDIPVRDELAPLFHVTMTGKIRDNPAGSTPAGTGRVWDSRDLPAPRFHGNFHPYIWVGAEERGICWFADNDRGWVLNARPEGDREPVPCQELIRRDGQLILRVNLVQKPVRLEEPRRIVFGLMATPGKPMPENWRNIFFRSCPPEGKRIQWMAAQYWGSPSVMYSKLPIDQDTSVLSKLQEARLGGGGWGQFMKAWTNRHLSGDISAKTYKSKKKVVGLLHHAHRISRGAEDFLTAYWEEFHATHAYHPEDRVFGDEWSSHAYPPSYLDFALWCGAEFVRRGIGLYFDNTFPKPTHDTVSTAAYELPNGRIQPSANIWRHREYLRRIWVIHRQLAPRATPPIIMLHMTNSHLPPYMVYGQANLDLEWLYGGGAAQAKYPPDLLRTESLGLKSGNIPTALGGGSHRTKFGALMVHEIRAKFKRVRLLDDLAEFGYTQPDAEVFNYWDPDPPLKTSDPRCKWLLVKHHGELMALFCTWNPRDENVEVQIDTGRLGLQPQKAQNVETDEVRDVQEGIFKFSMPGYGVRMFRIR